MRPYSILKYLAIIIAASSKIFAANSADDRVQLCRSILEDSRYDDTTKSVIRCSMVPDAINPTDCIRLTAQELSNCLLSAQ